MSTTELRPPGAAALRVLVVEDHQLVADGLRAGLAIDGFDVMLSSCAGPGRILEEAEAYRPDLVVLDLDLVQGGNGGDLIAPLTALGINVLVLTGEVERVRLAECLEAGAVGVATKAESFETVLAKVRRAAQGEDVTPESHRVRYMAELHDHREAARLRMVRFESLTPRERHVLAMILDGAPARVIARDSFVSLATVRSQIRSVLNKLGVNSQTAAGALARRSGWQGDQG